MALKRKKLFAAACILVSLAAGLAVMEVVVRSGVLDQSRPDDATWTPTEAAREKDRQIDRQNELLAQKHPFGFNDRVRSRKKAPGVDFRVAVLGDSFVWGDGVPYDVIWTHKLEKRFAQNQPNVEVLSWGKRGWSTADELDFLKKHGAAFEVDLLVVGWVVNDPDMGNFEHKELPWRTWGAPLFAAFPELMNAIEAKSNAFLYEHVLTDWGYSNWYEKLYTPQNLENYGKLLKEFARFCREQNLPVLFVLTPNNYAPCNQDAHTRVTPLLEAAGLPFLDLFPAISTRLGHRNYRDLCASPADPHPGDLVTTVYSDEVYQHLTSDPDFGLPQGNPAPRPQEG